MDAAATRNVTAAEAGKQLERIASTPLRPQGSCQTTQHLAAHVGLLHRTKEDECPQESDAASSYRMVNS